MLAQALILPLLDYCDVAYLDLTEDLLNKMERLQNQAIRRFDFHNVADARLRSCGDLSLRTPPCRTKTFAQSFTIRAARLWNKIPIDVRKSRNIVTFKTNLRRV
ncbi:hypothetical protein NE865_00840 [Phthorimaea operculella]|nr:hypothetical protein NE865_00840 [Phthorimaea operculella]